MESVTVLPFGESAMYGMHATVGVFLIRNITTAGSSISRCRSANPHGPSCHPFLPCSSAGPGATRIHLYHLVRWRKSLTLEGIFNYIQSCSIIFGIPSFWVKGTTRHAYNNLYLPVQKDKFHFIVNPPLVISVHLASIPYY